MIRKQLADITDGTEIRKEKEPRRNKKNGMISVG